MPRERPCDKTLHRRGPRLNCGASLGFGDKGREYAPARTRHSREPRTLAQIPERDGNVRKSRDRNGLQVIPTITLGKDVYFRRRRVSCQFRCREDRRRRHGDRGHDHRNPQCRQRYRNQALADATRERIRMQLARGETPESIIDAYVKDNGTASLAIPPNSGMMRSIYAVPIIALVGTGVALAVVLRRWRAGPAATPRDGGNKDDAPGAAGGKAPKRDAYDDRIDAELRDLDG